MGWDAEQAEDEFWMLDRTPGQIKRLKERTGMAISRLDAELRGELERRKTEIEIARRLKMIDEYGDGNGYESGNVIVFSRVFDHLNPKVYQYAAILCDNGKWYVTGGNPRTPQGVTWQELVFWLVSGDVPVPLAEICNAGK